MQRDYFWRKIVNHVYKTVSSCHSCAMNGTTIKEKYLLQIFSRNETARICRYGQLGSIAQHRKRKSACQRNHRQESETDTSRANC